MRTLCILVLLLLASPTLATTLTYLVEQEVDQADTFVQLTAKIQVDGPSLHSSIATAQSLIDTLKSIVVQDCQKHSKKAETKKCKEMVEDSKFQVEPKYHMVRKVSTFTLFILTHELTIRVKNLKGLGRLVDQIVEQGGGLITLKEVSWKTQNEVDPEVQSLRDGLAEGKQLCEKIQKELEEVVSVEELQESEEEEEEEGDPDLTPPQVEKVIFKFKVRCGGSKKAKKTK